MKNTYLNDMLELCNSTIESWQKYRQNLLQRIADQEKYEDMEEND